MDKKTDNNIIYLCMAIGFLILLISSYSFYYIPNKPILNITNGTIIDIPNTDKVCNSTIIQSDGLYCNIDNVGDKNG